jgi:hypothetical protein
VDLLDPSVHIAVQFTRRKATDLSFEIAKAIQANQLWTSMPTGNSLLVVLCQGLLSWVVELVISASFPARLRANSEVDIGGSGRSSVALAKKPG